MQTLQRVDYRRALTAPFEDPQWPMTLLWVTLAMLVPVVGPIVAFGYQSTMVEALAREGAGARFPVFQIERLAEYLQRGLRMFIVSLVVTVVVTPIGLIVLFGGNIVAAVLMSQQQAASSILGVMILCVGVVAFLLVVVLAMVVVTPLWVKAALESDLGRVFDTGFLRDFLRRSGRETVVAHLFQLVLNLGLMIAGVLLCFVGMFPALGIGMLVQAHLYGQLYLLYLGRGGTPIALPGRIMTP